MQSAWARLLRLIPPAQQDSLMVVTSNRTEFAVQAILRLDSEFIIIRGRLAGSQDQGRVFFIPCDKIDHVGFYPAVKEAEYNEMFGDLDAAPPTADSSAADANGFKAPIKSAVLERFRSRSAGGAPGSQAPRTGTESSPSLPSEGRPE
jgi:hypothetical protein